jgi:hypothetical protein
MIFYTFIYSWSARHSLITTCPFVIDEDNEYDDKDEDDEDNLDSNSRDETIITIMMETTMVLSTYQTVLWINQFVY